MRNSLKLAALGFAAILGGTAAQAATVSPDVYYWSGSTVAGSLRADPANVNDGDADFLSLGLGGFAVFSIPGQYTGPAAVVEVTFNLIDPVLGPYLESAQLYGATSFDGSTLTGFTALGSGFTNTDAVGGVSVAFSGTYTWLAILDTTPGSSPSNDGFDLASISVSAVPLPAAAPLLAAALGGLGIASRRRRNKKSA